MQGFSLYAAGDRPECATVRAIPSQHAEVERLAVEERKNAQKQKEGQRLPAQEDAHRKQMEKIHRIVQREEQKHRRAAVARREKTIKQNPFAFGKSVAMQQSELDQNARRGRI